MRPSEVIVLAFILRGVGVCIGLLLVEQVKLSGVLKCGNSCCVVEVEEVAA